MAMMGRAIAVAMLFDLMLAALVILIANTV